MLKKLFFVLFIGFSVLTTQAQYLFDQGDVAINAGVGLISMDGRALSLNISGELGLLPTGDVGVLAIGGAVEYKYSIINGQGYNQATIGPRAIWHIHLPFLERRNLDLYAGAGVGLKHYREHNAVNHSYDRKIVPYGETFAGGRMLFNNNIGAFLEFGIGAIAKIKAGVTYRL